MLGDPIESRRKEQLLFQIEQGAPEIIAAVAYVYELTPPIVPRRCGKFPTLDQRSGKEVNVDELLAVDDDPKILTIVFTERAFWASILSNEAR